MVLDSQLNLLGPYNDDRLRSNAQGTRRLVVQERLRGQFRTPGLRNVAVTGPYMHNGQLDSLRDALQHRLPPLAGRVATPLTARQVDDLAAFLSTLTDSYGERRPWSSAGLADCP